ncbi:MAG: response regulator [Solirubrobacteraceae bacterium]
MPRPEPHRRTVPLARILIVDDNLLIRSLLHDILSAGGHEVMGEAKDGIEAAARVRDLRPDLVTLDLVMPGRSGLPTLKHLLTLDHSLPVIICSAFLNKNHVLDALRLGAKGFIVKPFDHESVLNAVNGALGGTGVVASALVSAAPEVPIPADDGLARKREFARTDVRLRVILQAEHSMNFIDTSTINLSGSGMLLADDTSGVAAHKGLRLHLDTDLGFRLYLPGSKPPIDGLARVVRISEDGRVAVAFEHLEVTDYELLAGYLREHELDALA